MIRPGTPGGLASTVLACAMATALLFSSGCLTTGSFLGHRFRTNVTASEDSLRTAIFCSAYYGDKKQVAYLLETQDKDLVNHAIGPVGALYTSCFYSTSFTPLFVAVWQGDVDMVRLLIEHGASVDHELSAAPKGLTALACCVNVSIIPNRHNVASVLLHAGASPNVVSEGISLIESAVLSCDATFISILLASGADPNVAHDRDGRTPLHRALQNRLSLETIKLLVQAGTNLRKMDRWGATPLHTALTFRTSPETIRLLVESGADVNALTVFGDSPLDLAGDDEVREYLRHRGARPGKGLDPDQRKALADEILNKMPAAAAPQ